MHITLKASTVRYITCHLTYGCLAAASPSEAEKYHLNSPQLIRDSEKALRALWGL